MSKTLNVCDLVKGHWYRLTDIKQHPFSPSVEVHQPFQVVCHRVFMVFVQFKGSDCEQAFAQQWVDSGSFKIIKEPTCPTLLSRQCRILLRHLKRSNITQRQALMDHSIMALPRRVADLKEAGYNIEKVMKANPHTGQRYASYYLAG